MATWESETLPLVDYYRQRDGRSCVYRRIDGNRAASEIAKEVRETVLFADAPAVAA